MYHTIKTTRIFFAWLLFTISPFTTQATIHRIPEGVNGIAQAVSIAASGDTLTLTSSGGRYHETNRISSRRKALTIMSDPNSKEKPTWTTEDTRVLRVFQNITVQGIVFDGQNKTEYGNRSQARQPKEIRINDCIFENFTKDVITESNQPIALCEVKSSIFRYIGGRSKLKMQT